MNKTSTTAKLAGISSRCQSVILLLEDRLNHHPKLDEQVFKTRLRAMLRDLVWEFNLLAEELRVAQLRYPMPEMLTDMKNAVNNIIAPAISLPDTGMIVFGVLDNLVPVLDEYRSEIDKS